MRQQLYNSYCRQVLSQISRSMLAQNTHKNSWDRAQEHTVDHEIFIVNFFVDDLFRRKLNTQNILFNVCRPIPILVAKVLR